MASKLTIEQEKENYGAFIHEHLFFDVIEKLTDRVDILAGRPAVPTNPKGAEQANKDIKITYDAVTNALAYVIHYSPVNNPDPKSAIFMGYSEATDWTLKAADLPLPNKPGDTVYFYVQAFPKKGAGANDIAKAQDLNSTAWGSKWASPVAVQITA